jgi:hypothetical protein
MRLDDDPPPSNGRATKKIDVLRLDGIISLHPADGGITETNSPDIVLRQQEDRSAFNHVNTLRRVGWGRVFRDTQPGEDCCHSPKRPCRSEPWPPSLTGCQRAMMRRGPWRRLCSGRDFTFGSPSGAKWVTIDLSKMPTLQAKFLKLIERREIIFGAKVRFLI